MGRCYEFGVSIDDACEHAMSVVAEGGACECTVCAAHCPGRFGGCAQVVARPGYVPALAPSWARSGEQSAPPTPELAPPRRSSSAVDVPASIRAEERPLGAVASELAVIRELVEKLLDSSVLDPDIGGIGASMQARDEALTEVFDRFAGAHDRLTGEVRDTKAAQQQLAELLGRIEHRLENLEELIASRSGVMDWLRRLG